MIRLLHDDKGKLNKCICKIRWKIRSPCANNRNIHFYTLGPFVWKSVGLQLVVSRWSENVGYRLIQLSGVDNRLGFFKIDYRCHFRILIYPLPVLFPYAFYICSIQNCNENVFQFISWIQLLNFNVKNHFKA